MRVVTWNVWWRFGPWQERTAGGPTWDTANPFAARAFEPDVRCDYIHGGPTGPGGLGRVRAVRRAGDQPVDGAWPSDHAAVVADLASDPVPLS